MPAIRNILKHTKIEVADRRRKCHRGCGRPIPKGEACLVVDEGTGMGSKNYCRNCCPPILERAVQHLGELQSGIVAELDDATTDST